MTFHRRNREVVIQQRETTQDSTYGTTIEGEWEDIATVLADVRDTRPGRAESINNGVSISRRTATVSMSYRDDVDISMRILVRGRSPNEADAIMRIISPPAEVQNAGYRKEMEFLAEELSSEGQEP